MRSQLSSDCLTGCASRRGSALVGAPPCGCPLPSLISYSSYSSYLSVAYFRKPHVYHKNEGIL